jgi:predicted acylesterase/phospholipase RssA
MRVAWQAGVVRALLEEGLTFAHGDGTSGGIFTLAMLLSGLSPEEMCERWASIDVHDFVSLMPLTEYLKGPTELAAMGDADGLVRRVYPHLGIDVDRVRAAEGMAGTFNVCDFGDKTCVPVPHTEIATELLVAGMSLPLFMPAVTYRGRTWTDAVWIKDANLAEAVRRGAEEVWLAWCIGNTDRYGDGPLEQYVHMIEMSANGALFVELDQIAELNRRRAAGEAVFGHTRPVRVHVVKPAYPCPSTPTSTPGASRRPPWWRWATATPGGTWRRCRRRASPSTVGPRR